MNSNINKPPRPKYERFRIRIDSIWPILRVVAAIVALITGVFAASQAALATRLVQGQILSPTIEGSVSYRFGEHEDLNRVQGEMIDELFASVFEASQMQPNKPYSALWREVLPISRSIPSAQVELTARVENEGGVVATDVRLSVEWLGQITEIASPSGSAWEITGGGVGENSVLISVERLRQGEVFEVLVRYAPTEGTFDTITLDAWLASSESFPHYDYERLPLVFTVVPDDQPSRYDLISVRIASRETPAEILELVDASPGPVTVCREVPPYAGDKPSGATHKVQSGESLESIASTYKVTVGELIEVNKAFYPTLEDYPECVFLGWWMIIP